MSGERTGGPSDDRTGSDRPPADPAGDDFVAAADASLRETYEEPLGLEGYVERVLSEPSLAAHASKYLLAAIESAGSRTVVEEGERTERYRFFDDPDNDGEHAVLGNTDVLNEFVDDLRAVAAGRGKDEKILWVDGPTATGKSEFKRCLVNGLRAYSKTPEGRRYTLEWNIASATGGDRGLSYGETPATDEEDWYESPVQTHPLTVFPEPVREDLLDAINDASDGHVDVRVEGGLDPFSREAYEFLEERYRRQGVEDLFSAITDPQHLRVKNYVVDVGQGIGILHSEDDGSPKERLVGSWMAGMLQELDSRGRKNPQAFSYDGVLSQGNGLLTVVEDATQHADLLQRLLNVADEGTVKLDKAIGMDVDSQLLVISNPDLEATLNQHAGSAADPLKALKRRLDRHEFRYLTNLRLEVELLRRELTGITDVASIPDRESADVGIAEPLALTVRDGDGNVERELAPHTVEAAALYAVVSRLVEDDLPAGMNLVDKAILFDQGYVQEGDERVETDDVDLDDDADDGRAGIPVTYTRDVLAELVADRRDRHHPDLPVEHVVMPRDVLDAMVDGLASAPVFSEAERTAFDDRVVQVKNHVFDRQSEDVLAAVMRDKRVDEETAEEYVEHVYAWATDDTVETDRGERVEPDPLKMKVFEVEHLGQFGESDYDGDRPSAAVESFREDKVITALNRYAWRQRGEDFQVEDVDVTEIPVVKEVLESYDWDDVARSFEDFDPRQWDDPPEDTETERVKETTVENMVELFEYSPASAELTSRHVMSQVSHRWD
jgi:predicted Ser/Thr protein kinase